MDREQLHAISLQPIDNAIVAQDDFSHDRIVELGHDSAGFRELGDAIYCLENINDK